MGQSPASNRDPLAEPSLDRLPLNRPGRAAIVAAHHAALAGGRESYLDPETGYFVMTAATLLARGECCGCGCRHCPYEA